jgi:hypothetical protein
MLQPKLVIFARQTLLPNTAQVHLVVQPIQDRLPQVGMYE